MDDRPWTKHGTIPPDSGTVFDQHLILSCPKTTLFMYRIPRFLSLISAILLSASVVAQSTIQYPEEKHLSKVRQLTFGGDNAEAYWSFDSKMVSFQSNNKKWGLGCDQIFYM